MVVRVLLIEDDEDDYLLALDCIEMIEVAEYDVDWVSDGMQVANGDVDYANYDVVLCDYRVGGVTGVEIVEAAMRAGVATPFILLTGHSDREIDFAAMQAGAVDHLVKDRLAPEVLEKAIRYAINAADASRELKRQSEIMSAVMEATDIGISAVDADGRVATWNSRMAELLTGDDTSDEIVAASIEALVGQPTLLEGRPMELPRAAGEGVVEIHLSHLPGGGCTIACYDVTKHKAIEDTLRAAKDEAERLSKAKSMFIARLSHEMRTPLHAVIGFGEMLSAAPKSEIEEYGEIIVHSGRGLIAKIDQMLELSRMDLGELRSQGRPLRSHSVLREAVAGAIKNDPGLGRRLRICDVDIDLMLCGDHRLLANALTEFIGNAAKYGDPAAEIELGCDLDDDGVQRLWVRNRPTEFETSIINDPFESFGQSEAAQGLDRNHGGLGLGLTYARAVARLHGGEARLITADGEAATIAALVLPPATAHGDGAATAWAFDAA